MTNKTAHELLVNGKPLSQASIREVAHLFNETSPEWKKRIAEARPWSAEWNGDFIPMHIHDFPRDRWSIRRYLICARFLSRWFGPETRILDLGTENGLGNFLKTLGYRVENTKGQDLDVHRNFLRLIPCDLVTSFEVFEHLLSPLEVLKALPGNHLITSVPLRLWFAPAFRNQSNPAGRHYHEFEPWQFMWLLEKAGWKVVYAEKHTAPSFRPGLRTILRWITPRYLIVYAVRNE